MPNSLHRVKQHLTTTAGTVAMSAVIGLGVSFAYSAAMTQGFVDPEPSAEVFHALADGRVTADEYDSVMTQFAACVADRGVQHEVTVTDPKTGWTLVAEPDDLTADERSSVQWCSAKHVGDVVLYRAASDPGTATTEVLDAVRDCLAERGVTVSANADNLWDVYDEVGFLTSQPCLGIANTTGSATLALVPPRTSCEFTGNPSVYGECLRRQYNQVPSGAGQFKTYAA